MDSPSSSAKETNDDAAAPSPRTGRSGRKNRQKKQSAAVTEERNQLPNAGSIQALHSGASQSIPGDELQLPFATSNAEVEPKAAIRNANDDTIVTSPRTSRRKRKSKRKNQSDADNAVKMQFKAARDERKQQSLSTNSDINEALHAEASTSHLGDGLQLSSSASNSSPNGEVQPTSNTSNTHDTVAASPRTGRNRRKARQKRQNDADRELKAQLRATRDQGNQQSSSAGVDINESLQHSFTQSSPGDGLQPSSPLSRNMDNSSPRVIVVVDTSNADAGDVNIGNRRNGRASRRRRNHKTDQAIKNQIRNQNQTSSTSSTSSNRSASVNSTSNNGSSEVLLSDSLLDASTPNASMDGAQIGDALSAVPPSSVRSTKVRNNSQRSVSSMPTQSSNSASVARSSPTDEQRIASLTGKRPPQPTSNLPHEQPGASYVPTRAVGSQPAWSNPETLRQARATNAATANSSTLQADNDLEHGLEGSGNLSIVAELAPSVSEIESRLREEAENRLQEEIERLRSSANTTITAEVRLSERNEDTTNNDASGNNDGHNLSTSARILPADAGPSVNKKAGLSRNVVYCGLIALVVIIVVIVVAYIIVLGQKDTEDNVPISPANQNQSSLAPNDSFDQSLNNLLDLIGKDITREETVGVDDFSSLQFEALSWLVNNVYESIRESQSYDEQKLSLIEYFAVLMVYFSTDGPNWEEQLNFLSQSSLCSWSKGGLYEHGETTARGIRCNYESGRVTDIVLDENGLHGSIPTEIGLLVHLEKITLYGNSLTGHIPPEVGVLQQLTSLALRHNELSGRVPQTMGGIKTLERVSRRL